MLLSTVPFRSLSSLRPCFRRTLFSLPSLPFGPDTTRPKTYNDERVFPYNEKELYAVVADVASYPSFIPFCLGSRIDSSALQRAMREKTVVDAELTVGFMSFKESYVSTVTCIPFESVQACASSSTPLFKALSTTWKFRGLSPGDHQVKPNSGPSTLVSYDLTFQFANPLHAGVSSTFFGQVSSMMIDAFEKRCISVYGPRP